MEIQITGERYSKRMEEARDMFEISGRDIGIDTLKSSSVISSSDNDDFSVNADQIMKLGGLSHNFKRSAKRKIEKADQNSLSGDMSDSKQLIPDKYGYGLFDVVEPPYNLTSLSKIYEVSAANYAAINAKVANIVGLGYNLEPTLKVLQMLEDVEPSLLSKRRRRIELGKQELEEWLESRNDEDTFTATLIKAYIDKEATGNGYLEIGRKVTGEIGYIGHIPAATMRVRRLRDGFVQIVNGKAVFFRNFQDVNQPNPFGVDTRPNEIIHLKSYTPTNTYYGIPPVVAAKNAMAGTEFASRFNLEYFENKATPRYIFWIKGAKLNKEAEAKLFEFFQNNLRGQSHRTLVVPIPGDQDGQKVDVKMEAVENGIQDSSFNNYRRSNLSEVLMAHRVPISKVGTSENISLANAREADRTFKDQVCRPEQDTLEKSINRIIAEKTDMFRLKFNELTLTDEDTQSKIDERYLRMQVITPNEVRSRKGMTALPEGDQTVVLTAQARAEQNTQANGNRQRDQQREANAADTGTGSRVPQGEGRQQA
jgi:PBSX family phage portal protein